MLIGIIYKFTIIAKSKRDNCKPFYIGQHWEKCSVERFLSRKSDYWGSGNIWLSHLDWLRKQNPNNWKYFVKREILYSSESITQRGLDTLERHFIKKYKSHYSNKNGGCNVIVGTANKFGSTNPMYDKEVIDKVREKKRGRFGGKNCYWYGKHLSEETKRKIGELARERFKNGHPCRGKKMSDEARETMCIAAAKRDRSTYAHGFSSSEEHKEKIRKSMLKYYETHNSPFKGRTHNAETRKKLGAITRQRFLNKNN